MAKYMPEAVKIMKIYGDIVRKFTAMNYYTTFSKTYLLKRPAQSSLGITLCAANK
jgi:hypothetical protein